MKKPWIFLLLILIGVSVPALLWFRREQTVADVVARSVPPEPDLTAASPILRARLSEIEEKLEKRGLKREALGELSRVYHANGYMTEAVSCYSGLEQLEPKEPRWFYRHSVILAGYGDIDPALQLLLRTTELEGSYLPAQLRLADVYLKKNESTKAASIYQTILQKSPSAHYALLGLARIDYEANRLSQAKDRLESLVKATHYELGYDLIVEVYEKLGMREQAEAVRGTVKASGAFRDPPDPWVDELMEECFDPYRLSLAGGAADRSGDMATAIRLLERAAQYAPNDLGPRFQLGNVYLQRGDVNAALPHFKQCTTMAPDFADGWAYLSDALGRLGDAPAASRTILTGLSHCPDSPGLHLMRARELRNAGQLAAAIDEFKSSIRLRPNEAEAYIELGNMLIQSDRVAEGIAQIEMSLVAEPENPAALGVLAIHAISTGHENDAKQWLERAKKQPRMRADQVERLQSAFQTTFGHAP